MTKLKKQRRKRKLEVDADDERELKKEARKEEEEAQSVVVEEVMGAKSILPTRELYREQLMVLLKSGQLALIQGEMGCGKTFLAKNVAMIMKLPAKVMQMGDQLDSKSLFGSYECTEVAGHFKWKKSNFHQWLTVPGVIVMEDIDTANADVISAVISISKSRRMVLPIGESVNLHSQCHLIATIQSNRCNGRRNGVLDALHSRIDVPSLSDEEMKRLGKAMYPRIEHIVNPICKIFREVQCLPCGGNSRKLTSSDLMRAFSRVNINSSTNKSILLELMDVWCVCEPSMERRLLICTRMASLLSLTKDEAESSMKMHSPELCVSESTVNVGRVSLDRRAIVSMERTTRLGHTKGALQLLERMTMSVKMEEPVLLVGESGVGKTSLVQALADLKGEKLATVNLGPHTDMDDLITSLRPTSYGRIMEPFTRDFVDLFCRSFDHSKNEKFMHNLQVMLMHQKYDEYLKVVEETAKRILCKKKESEWADVVVRSRRLREGLEKGASPFMVQRGIVREAADEGYWLLIDEINLASPECLDAIVDAISSAHHPNFRLFACMNPATDTAKRRLAQGIRSIFTEYFVTEDSDAEDLKKIVSSYLPSTSLSTIDAIVKLYIDAKKSYPHKLSLRSLTRALLFAADSKFDNENRCLYEAFAMAFLSNMEKEEKISMHNMIKNAFPCEKKSPMRRGNELSMLIEGYEVERGDSIPVEDKGYIITPTVQENLREVARIVSNKRLSVLLEGETSAGKTSIVQHLAKITGNTIKRINNHEQTDVQEYMGSYVPDSKGRLYFREGPLVEAVRKGYWVILDELNLAPSDVIETLNRLLDDNRELMICESNEVIKAHPRFRLFATQNPAGSYSGRKRLSRALLSRFVVLQFPTLPLNELSQMVCARCQIAPSAADRMINVLSQLRLQRSLSGLFSAKDGLMTLRDVFRWGHRLASDEGKDWQAAMIHHGYFLLAGRCRNEGDKKAVISTLESTLKGKIDEKELFSVDSPYFPRDLSFEHIILTSNMRRMLVLSWQALIRNEAVLVVGETGDGKTRLAQTIGGEEMMTINCHERTECSDLMGRLRPASNGGFQWQDGVVISAMREGKVLLMDEIALAEDSVLERLNPLFEENRAILLTDCGAEAEEVTAQDSFKVIATMNPGGDYGKKELSKALRNRFTEIWSSSSFDRAELCSIFAMKITKKMDRDAMMRGATIVIHWINQFNLKFSHALRVSPSVRDVVACAEMWNALIEKGMENGHALIETISSVFIDAMPCQMTRTVTNIQQMQQDALSMIVEMTQSSVSSVSPHLLVTSTAGICMGDLSLPFGPIPPSTPRGFSLSAPTCMENMYRVIRALSINKPILLEGSPGCGKSTLIMALASLGGYPLTRLNLSEQTDLSDLFGSDIPVVDDEGNMSFEWKDGPVLKAIKNGEWILLDEMNLASQSILEGLNACFDHRRVLYIAELAKEFAIPSSSQCRFFACQNPRVEGGCRRALPKSFVNRFTNIYTADLKEEDELAILNERDEGLDGDTVERMVKVNCALSKEVWTGGPYSFNLRDINRWMGMISKSMDIGYSFETLYVNRLRVEEEKQRAREIFKEIMEIDSHSNTPFLSIDDETVRIGPLQMNKGSGWCVPSSLHPISSQSSTLLSVMNCLSNGWITLLVGPRNAGKRSIAEMATSLIGMPLEVISLSSDTDASELIGSFEQKVDDGSLVGLVDSLSALLSPLGMDVDGVRKCKDVQAVESAVELILTTHTVPPDVETAVRNLVLVSHRSEMYFEWVDSVFVRAYTQGKCILIQNVNMCNAAVLDRLNTCMEAGGSLVLSESRGDYQPIPPHKDFRVILTMDSSEGEISRAMRNRSVEIFMGGKSMWNERERDVQAILTCLSRKDVVSNEMASALTGLPFRSILFSGLVLSHYEEETVVKLANRQMDDEMSENKRRGQSIVPPLNEWTDIERLSEWILDVWMESSEGDGQRFAIPLLPILTSSINVIRSTGWQRKFGDRGCRLVGGVLSLLSSSPSNHPIDPSLYGDRSVSPMHKLYSSLIFHWLSLLVDEMEKDECSALHIASSQSRYEITTSPLYFDKMESSPILVREIMEAFMREVMEMEIEISFPISISILSLIDSLSRSLSIRSGNTRIRIAYSSVVERGKSLSLKELEEWTIPSSIQQLFDGYKEKRVMEPFTTKEDIQTLIESVKRVREIGSEDGEKEGLLSVVGVMGGRLEKTLTLNADTHTMMCMNSLDNGWMRVVESLKWKNEDGKRTTVVSSMLSMDISSDITLSSLLSISPVSLLLSTLWQQLGWDAHMRCITVRNVRDLSFDSLVSQLWRIGVNSRRIDASIRKNMELIGMERNSCDVLSFGIKMMENGLPHLSSIDPVIYGEEYGSIVRDQMRVVQSIIDSLGKWRILIGGNTEMVEECSSHPFVRSLYEWRQKLREEIEKLEGGMENKAYREESKLYTVMCREMHAVMKVCSSVERLIGEEKWKENEDLELMSAHVVSTMKSTQTFLEGSLIRFGSLLDVMGGFWNAVWIVHVALNTVHYEMRQHSTRLSLISSSAFPRYLESPSFSWLGPMRESLVAWSIRSSSPLPLDLQAAIVEWKISKGETGRVEIEWIRNQWEKWYEKNGANETAKEFEYKDKTMEEKEEMEMEEMWSGVNGMEGVLREDTLVEILDRFTHNTNQPEKPFNGKKRLVAAFAYLTSLSGECGVKEEWKNCGVDASIYALRRKGEGGVMDVYRETDWNQVKEVIGECEELRKKTDQLRQKWPEVQSLSLIIDSIESLMDSTLSIGQMRMAEKLEKIIEECEEWEKLADREHSMRSVLSPLRERLVVWKKMEIVCWNKLVDRVASECEQRAALVAFPLFEALLKDDSCEDSLIAMAAHWIYQSSFIDFNQRLRSVSCLAQWARVVGKNGVAEKLHRIVGYFGQLKSKVNGTLKDIVDPIERLMKDLVKIAQYKDLNILSIKTSSKKNHAQLFKMVKRLKNEGGAEMSGMMNSTIDIEGWRRIEEEEREGEGEGREEWGGIVKRAMEISNEIVEKRREKTDWMKWIEMGENVESVRKECAVRIEYSGDEKEMESQQGRERNSRQRAVALIIKECQSVGMNSRRGMTLNGEDISRRTLTHINPIEDNRRNIVRALGLARSILIRRGMKPNEQLSTSTRGHLLGMVEYGCHYLMENEGRIDEWREMEKEMLRLEECLKNEVQNEKAEMDGDSDRLNHRGVKEALEQLNGYWNQLDQLIQSMKMRLATVPSCVPDWVDEWWSPLSRLSSSSSDLPQVSELIEDMSNLSERINSQLSIIVHNGVCGVYSRLRVVSTCGVVEEIVEEWMGRLDHSKYWFEEETHIMSDILSKMKDTLSTLPMRSHSERFSIDTQSMILFIQRLYKSSVERGNEWERKEIDALSHSALTLHQANPKEMISIMCESIERIKNGDGMEEVRERLRLFSIARSLFTHCISIHERCSQSVAVVVHRVTQLGIHLMEKGYMNTIPKEEKKKGGEGKEMEGEGGGGMGEGSGSKDVTEEMEETGQIEGLKGDEEEEEENGGGDNGKKENDKPIEMEEDFAKDLEDVDKEEEDDSGDENEEDGGEEPPMDDVIGDVDDKDDEDIDPHLWNDDEKEKNDEKNMDHDNKGADEETGEMAAREDKNAEVREDEEKEGEEEGGEEEEGEKEEKEDMEYMDENERENKDELEGKEDGETKDESDEQKMEDYDQMDIGEDDVDKEENEGKEEEGLEENEGEETNNGDEIEEEKEEEINDEENGMNEKEMNEEIEENGEEKGEEEKEEKKMESGFGGERNEEEEEGGGRGAEREEEEEEDDEKGDDGVNENEKKEGKMKSEKGEDEKKKEKKEEKESEENVEEKEQMEKKREIVMDDDVQAEEESEIVDGNEDVNGEERKESAQMNENERMMSGAGTVEEAKESAKRRDKKMEKKNEKTEVKGGEMGMGEDEDEGNDTIINFNHIDLMSLTEKMSRDLIMGKNEEAESDEILEVKEKKNEAELSELQIERCRREWERMAPVVSLLAAELSENLRLILEPRLANRMEGDYKSGKRLNMKRIIPYIASQYRKNRIWMRRTKKAERNYQVLIAVDDSASMAENGMETLTCQGVCIVEEALRRVNAGQLSVMTFGEEINQIIPFTHASTTQSTGERMLSSLSFNQSSTDICGMLRRASNVLEEVASARSEQMLIVISDGRGALANGAHKIRWELSRLSRVAVLFVILDCGKQSIKEMKVASFEREEVKLVPYLSLFPFPLYVLAQCVTHIPSLLAEAIRQWIEHSSEQ